MNDYEYKASSLFNPCSVDIWEACSFLLKTIEEEQIWRKARHQGRPRRVEEGKTAIRIECIKENHKEGSRNKR